MKNFTQIENKKIKDATVTDGAFRTFTILFSFKFGNKGRVFPSIQTIAKLRGKTSRAITTHLKELRLKGWIKSKKRGYSTSNLYDFVGVENFQSIWKKSSYQYGRKLLPNNTKDNKTKSNKIDFGNLKGIEGMRKVLIKKMIIPPVN